MYKKLLSLILTIAIFLTFSVEVFANETIPSNNQVLTVTTNKIVKDKIITYGNDVQYVTINKFKKLKLNDLQKYQVIILNVDKKKWSTLRKDDIVQLIDNGVNLVFDSKDISLSDVQKFLGDKNNVEVEDQEIKPNLTHKEIIEYFKDNNTHIDVEHIIKYFSKD